MSYLYAYLIEHTQTIIKAGHGQDANGRMTDYCKQHGLKPIHKSLQEVTVSFGLPAEQWLHQQLEKLGYRNIRVGNTGAQELFQAPRGVTKSKAITDLKNLLEKWAVTREYEDVSSDQISNTSKQKGYNFSWHQVRNMTDEELWKIYEPIKSVYVPKSKKKLFEQYAMIRREVNRRHYEEYKKTPEYAEKKRKDKIKAAQMSEEYDKRAAKEDFWSNMAIPLVLGWWIPIAILLNL